MHYQDNLIIESYLVSVEYIGSNIKNAFCLSFEMGFVDL